MIERALSKDEKIALYEDMLGITENRDRYARLRDTYGMSPGATWLLSRLVAAKGRWLPVLTLLEAIPSPTEADDRDLSAVKVRVHEIRKALGRAAVEWDREMGYRLSSAARAWPAGNSAGGNSGNKASGPWRVKRSTARPLVAPASVTVPTQAVCR